MLSLLAKGRLSRLRLQSLAEPLAAPLCPGIAHAALSTTCPPSLQCHWGTGVAVQCWEVAAWAEGCAGQGAEPRAPSFPGAKEDTAGRRLLSPFPGEGRALGQCPGSVWWSSRALQALPGRCSSWALGFGVALGCSRSSCCLLTTQDLQLPPCAFGQRSGEP